MPVIQVQMMQGRTEEKIKLLINNITDTVSETLDVPKERVRVLINEIPKTHYGIAGVPQSEVAKNA